MRITATSGDAYDKAQHAVFTSETYNIASGVGKNDGGVQRPAQRKRIYGVGEGRTLEAAYASNIPPREITKNASAGVSEDTEEIAIPQKQETFMTQPKPLPSSPEQKKAQAEWAKMVAEFDAKHNVTEFTESEKAERLKQPMQATFPQGKSPKMRQQEAQQSPKK